MASTSAIDSSLTQTTKAAGLSIDDFLRILMTELTYQDPLKPVENKDFLAQIAQFASLDTTRQLNDNIKSLLSMQSLNQSVGLLGKTVDATQADGTTVSGQVAAIQMSSGTPEITLKSSSGEVFAGLSLSQIKTVR